MSDIEGVINLHREGTMATASLNSARIAAERARADGVSVELTLVLDRSDTATRDVAKSFAARSGARVHEVDYGDLAESRNHAVRCGDAAWCGFLDADDLWSANWLLAAWRLGCSAGPRTICHPAWNVIFGTKQMLFPQIDQLDRRFSRRGLETNNYWTALSFAPRAIYLEFPYRPNRLDLGFGFEDWAWNLQTVDGGCVHRAVPETSHFIRYKASDSLRDATSGRGCLRTPADLDRIAARFAAGRSRDTGDRHVEAGP